jgi:hypothetical protein
MNITNMKQWAVAYNNEIINRVIWSGESSWTYPFPHDELIPDDDNIYKIGMVKQGDTWVVPETQPEPQTPTIDMVVHDLGEHLKPYLKQNELSSDTLYMFSALYPEWTEGEAIQEGDIRSYKGQIYEIVQPHTTQAGWEPDVTPALWNVFTPAGIIPAWLQPLGSHDAYQTGAKVTHNGKTWECAVDNNVWEPGIYGWTEIL